MRARLAMGVYLAAVVLSGVARGLFIVARVTAKGASRIAGASERIAEERRQP